MTELMALIKERRSIRKYEETPVPEADLNRILEAVQWAPSWTNCQCWEVVVVRDAQQKQALQETVPTGNPGRKAVGAAPVVLAVCGKKGVSGFYENKPSTKLGDWFLFDLGLATQNLCLMAHSLGLGTVIMGLLDHDRAGRILNLPDGYEAVVLIPLGYPAKASRTPPRREVADFSHSERFGE